MLFKACDICQRTRIKLLKHCPDYPRIPVDYSAMESFLGDIKFSLKGFDDFNILVTTCEIINFALCDTNKIKKSQRHCRSLDP